MSLTSVIENPSYLLDYPEDGFGLFQNIVAKGIYAFTDSNTSLPQNLLVGASCNLNLEAVNDMNLYVKGTGAVNLYVSSFESETRTDTELLSIFESNLNATIIEAPSSHAIQLVPTDTYKTTLFGDMSMYTSNNINYIQSAKNEIRIKSISGESNLQKIVVVDGALAISENASVVNNMTVGQALKANGMFSRNVNVYKDIVGASANQIDQVGFALNINDSNQLEIVKVIRYNDAETDSARTIVKRRVAVFDHRQSSSNAASDSAYGEFSTLYNVDQIQVSGSAVTTSTSETWAKSGGALSNIYYSRGAVAINATTPTTGYKLDVNGSAYVRAGFSTSNILVSDSYGTPTAGYKLDVQGNILSSGTMKASQFLVNSDRRLKENIEPIVNSLEKLDALQGYTYTYINDSTQERHMGLVAQEVEAVLPEVVSTDAYTGYKSIAYPNMVAFLVETVKELRAEVNALKAKCCACV